MEPPPPRPWQRFLAGSVSGAALTLVGHPLDTLRVRLQVGGGAGGLPAAVRALNAEGLLRGWYRGFLPPFVLTGCVNTVLWGVQFSTVDALKQRGAGSDTTRAMAAAVPASLASALIVAPMELLKTRQQTQGGHQPVFTLLRGIVQREGAAGAFRGAGVVVSVRLLGGWGYFGGNQISLQFLESIAPSRGSSAARVRNTLLAGGFAGICYWSLAMPLDTVKTLVMASAGAHAHGAGAAEVARSVWRSGGPRALYKGFSAAILRAFPANAAAFTAFDLTMRALQ